MSTGHPLLVIVGPTGSGKTALSLALAERFDSEIVSCDSVAVYRDFEIGTAKPSVADRTRIRHHMIDVASPAAPFTAGEYARQARGALADIAQRGKLPVVVAGTGLYLRALIDGLFAGPQRSDALRIRLQQSIAKRPPGHLHRVLSRLDPEAATRIHANDVPKIIRAIEVCLSGGERISEMFRRGRDPLTGFRITSIGLNPDRDLLYQRINARCESMFGAGLVDETGCLLRKYPVSDLSTIPNHPLNALGYRQVVQYLRGERSLPDAVAATQQAHRNFAKRQLTWFRNVGPRDAHWLAGVGDDPNVQAEACRIAEALLAN
jgi:tRNA dimethylallyltransferase